MRFSSDIEKFGPSECATNPRVVAVPVLRELHFTTQKRAEVQGRPAVVVLGLFVVTTLVVPTGTGVAQMKVLPMIDVGAAGATAWFDDIYVR